MIRLIRSRMQHGQALTELALVIPILFGFVAVTLQGGLVISDQVNLSHAAYEGAQWAVVNRTTATTDDVENHILSQLCGTSGGEPISTGSSSALTRYCRTGSLSVHVTASNTPTSMSQGPNLFTRLGVVREAEASACKSWSISVSPSPASVARGTTKTLTVSVTTTGSGTDPVVTPTITGLPGYESNGTPQFDPPSIITPQSPPPASSSITIAPSARTGLGSYKLHVSGVDQCGGQPTNSTRSGGPGADDTLTVTSGGGPFSLPSGLNLGIDGLFPVCLPLGSPSTITVYGWNFQTGATFTVGAGSSSVSGTVNVTSSGQATVTIPAITTSGVLDGTIQNPDGSSYTVANAITVASSCPSYSPSPNPATLSGASTACEAASPHAAGNPYEVVITLTWNEALVIPWLTSTVPLTAVQKAFCQ